MRIQTTQTVNVTQIKAICQLYRMNMIPSGEAMNRIVRMMLPEEIQKEAMKQKAMRISGEVA